MMKWLRKWVKKMKLKNWTKWLLFNWVLVDFSLVTIWLYMLRIIEIGG